MKACVYRAGWVVPVSTPPIRSGWIAIADGVIIAIGGPENSPPTQPIDLGDVAILPALVNAHTHLEFSRLASPIGKAGIKLHDWIGEVVKSRGVIDPQQPIDPSEAIAHGMNLCHQSGVGLVADIATTPYPAIDSACPTNLDVVAFAEVLGLNQQRSDAKLNLCRQHFKQFSASSRIAPAVSPHSPYSTPIDVVRRCVEMACEEHSLLAMHVAESPEERQLIEQGRGPFAARLREIQVFSTDVFPWGENATLDLLRTLAGAPRVLLIHGNDLRPIEIEYIASQPHMTVVYCPRTHAYFGHSPHPVAKLLGAGIRVALGTDSLASNPDLSLWSEVQWLLKHREDLAWHDALAMATYHGAEALERSDLGRLEVGAKARLLSIEIMDDDFHRSFLTHVPRWIDASVTGR